MIFIDFILNFIFFMRRNNTFARDLRFIFLPHIYSAVELHPVSSVQSMNTNFHNPTARSTTKSQQI